MSEIAGIALSVQRRGYGEGIRVIVVQFPAGTETWCGAYRASFSMGTGGSFPNHKADGAWSWSLSLNAKNEWIYISAPPAPSWSTEDNITFPCLVHKIYEQNKDRWGSKHCSTKHYGEKERTWPAEEMTDRQTDRVTDCYFPCSRWTNTYIQA